MPLSKDLFSGSLGKTEKLLRSRYAATPNTKELNSQPEYCNARGELVTCTLDGLLWMYRNGDNYQFFLHAWDPEQGILNENVNNAALNIGYNIVALRGIDWLLTRYHTIRAVEEHYGIYGYSLISTDINLRGASGLNSLLWYDLVYYYSFLREWDTARITVNGRPCGPGIDPFTFQGYGSDGAFNPIGYYPASYVLSLYGGFDQRPLDDCYSLLPMLATLATTDDVAVGGWYIIEDFLVRCAGMSGVPLRNSPIDLPGSVEFNNAVLEARPLIPLEFNYYPNEENKSIQSFCSFGTGHSRTRRGIQVAAGYDQLFARGLMHLGRAFILPAAFDRNGDAEEFYLYIQNSWNCRGPYDHYDASTQTEAANADWLNTSIAALRDEDTGLAGVVAFRSERQDPLRSSICRRSSGDILLPVTNEKFLLDDGAHGYFDAYTQTGLVLTPQGASFLSWDSANDRPVLLWDCQCSTLEKWLAPGGRIDMLNPDGILASDDDGMLATDLGNGFFRTRFFTGGKYEKILPATWKSFFFATGETDGNGSIEVIPERLSLAKDKSTNKIHMQRLKHDDLGSTKIMPWSRVFRNPISVRVLQTGFYDGIPAILKYMPSAGFTECCVGPYRSSLPGGYWGCYPEPCPIPMLVDDTLLTGSTVQNIAYYLINPDTGALSRSTFGHSGGYPYKFPVLNDEKTLIYAINEYNEMDYGEPQALPDWCKDWTLLPPTICDENGNLNPDVPGVLPKCFRLPDYAHTEVTDQNVNSDSYLTSTCYTNRKGANMFKYRPVAAPRDYLTGARWREDSIRNTNDNDFLIDFQESSSLMPFTIRSPEFKMIADMFRAGSTNGGHLIVDGVYMYDSQLKTSEDFADIGMNVYGKDPIINWRGQRKYTKNLFVMRLGPGYKNISGSQRIYGRYYMNGDLYGAWGNEFEPNIDAGTAMLWVFRIDLDPEIFDFDAEVLRSRRR